MCHDRFPWSASPFLAGREKAKTKKPLHQGQKKRSLWPTWWMPHDDVDELTFMIQIPVSLFTMISMPIPQLVSSVSSANSIGFPSFRQWHFPYYCIYYREPDLPDVWNQKLRKGRERGRERERERYIVKLWSSYRLVAGQIKRHKHKSSNRERGAPEKRGRIKRVYRLHKSEIHFNLDYSVLPYLPVPSHSHFHFQPPPPPSTVPL